MRRTLFAAALLVSGCAGFGRTPGRAERASFRSSPQFEGRTFHNPEPMYLNTWGALVGGRDRSLPTEPEPPLQVEPIPAQRFDTPPSEGLRVTWLGHSSVLLEVDGHRVLTDPHFGPRSSPFRRVGPKRWYPSPLALEDVPQLDAVLISHDHYDHLDHTTLQRMHDWDTRFIVPLGVGQHLQRWGVPAERITEVDWWDEIKVGELRIACVPARHASGRRVTTRDRTLWAGYAVLGREHRVYFSGDTGLFPAMQTVGERYGPFDLTMIEVGQYDDDWPDWHLGPEQAVLAHQMVRGKVMLPVHWGLFRLAAHGWTEPIERVHVQAAKVGVTVTTPKPGQSLQPSEFGNTAAWWPDVPWTRASDNPINATVSGDKDQRMDLPALFERFSGP